MAITDVSPIEPGIKPSIVSLKLAVGILPEATSPRGVAIVVPSGSTYPKPHTCSFATQTLSPLMLVGYEKNKNARATKAGLKIFMPVPPNISLQKITEKATAKANIHNGQFTGTISGIKIPVTR